MNNEQKKLIKQQILKLEDDLVNSRRYVKEQEDSLKKSQVYLKKTEEAIRKLKEGLK